MGGQSSSCVGESQFLRNQKSSGSKTSLWTIALYLSWFYFDSPTKFRSFFFPMSEIEIFANFWQFSTKFPNFQKFSVARHSGCHQDKCCKNKSHLDSFIWCLCQECITLPSSCFQLNLPTSQIKTSTWLEAAMPTTGLIKRFFFLASLKELVNTNNK